MTILENLGYISMVVLKEWQRFPLQEEQSPPHQFQVRCQQPLGSTAPFPIVWLVPVTESAND